MSNIFSNSTHQDKRAVEGEMVDASQLNEQEWANSGDSEEPESLVCYTQHVEFTKSDMA